jgi:hypothetical protein
MSMKIILLESTFAFVTEKCDKKMFKKTVKEAIWKILANKVTKDLKKTENYFIHKTERKNFQTV